MRALLVASLLAACSAPPARPDSLHEEREELGGPAALTPPGARSATAAPASAEAPAAPAGSAAASAGEPPEPPHRMTPCPEDMVLAGRACIDRYEAPNQKGVKPLRMQSALDAEAWCKERGRRLCTEDEWVRACEGPDRLAFPYGPKWERGRCNDDGSFRNPSWKILARWPAPEAVAESDKLDQSDPSGAREGCASVEGVHDLSGNVAEWVRRTKDNPTNYEHVVKGCFWGRCFRPPHLPSCDYVNFAHPSGYRSYEMGFRCCVAPQL